jgi:hypothetical protein
VIDDVSSFYQSEEPRTPTALPFDRKRLPDFGRDEHQPSVRKLDEIHIACHDGLRSEGVVRMTIPHCSRLASH